MKYTTQEIAVICKGTLVGIDRQVGSVFCDSRTFIPQPDPMFAAIDGINHDGHDYIADLYGRGVRVFMTERPVPHGEYPEATFIEVASTLEALQKLAARYRSTFRGQVVAITGSNGKTVVKEWLSAVAPGQVSLFRSPRSYNSQLGVALSLLMASPGDEVVLIEAGISQPGEMARLEEMIRPDVGLITNIGTAHSSNFPDSRALAREKLSLFSHTPVIIYNGADQLLAQMAASRYHDRQLIDFSSVRVDATFEDPASRQNSQAVMAVAGWLGWDTDSIRSRLSELRPLEMRLELKQGVGDSVIINDTYTSDINSFKIALDHFATVAAGRRKVLIMSGILQSGMNDRELYNTVGQMLRTAGIDLVLAVGIPQARVGECFPEGTRFYPDTAALLRVLDRNTFPDSAILVKGNRESRLEQVVALLESKKHTTVLEIDLDAMVNNLNIFRSLTGAPRLMAMVKASGYGSGDSEIATLLQHEGVDYLAVAFADEGVRLRTGGVTMPIVVLNADSESFAEMISSGLEPEIYNFDSLNNFINLLRSAGECSWPLHIKLDTGMHRLGFTQQQLGALIEILVSNRTLLRVGSVFSHLAAAEDPRQDSFTLCQIEAFERMYGTLAGALGYRPLAHIANTAAMVRFPQARLDMVRLGIGLYGTGPGDIPGIVPTARLVTRVVQVKDVPAGETVGYGREGVAHTDRRIAILPLGYADGLDRRLGSGRWNMIHGRQSLPTFGRISMDTCALDITGTEVKQGDTITVFGPEAGNTVADMARVLDTIPYEILTGISSRVKRIYLRS